MISFFAVILTVIFIVGGTVLNYYSNYVYSSTYDQLTGYGQNAERLVARTSSDGHYQINAETIRNIETVFKNQKVNFAIYSAATNQTNGNLRVYPAPNENAMRPVPLHLTKAYWQTLKKSEYIRDVSSTGKLLRMDQMPTGAQPEAYVVVPWFYENKMIAAVVVSARIADINSNINQIESNMFVALIISLVLALILAYLLARYQVSRVNQVRHAAHEVADGNFDIDLPSKHRDEIDDLASDFNIMAKSLQDSQNEIERQEERRKEFMANAAHEMRTPLTTINGLLEGLAYDAIPEESKGKSIELMRGETKRLIRLVNENLDYEKIRTGQIRLSEREFDAMEPLHNIVTQLTQKAAEAKDKLILEGTAPVQVYADYDRFVQIIFNVIQNAIQFTQNGQITIKAERGFHEAAFTISDTGIGMTPDQVRNIWDRYYKADPSRKNTKYGESGLGLSIVHSLVKQHGGDIKVHSQLHEGTTFKITFPDSTEPKEEKPKLEK
ncbi:two-component system, sensor histidine kinase [Schleiferilactobacillus perolens DSM 12744]|uniref:histidine kinase n=2 Tax=Schleiferilactobacillus perolens TaxID=100468 RepID=A0A0R1N238_9LACO|nr:two-component system, sensor histidine kinase [Schleiferilactobacillus perolens DSM 12744]